MKLERRKVVAAIVGVELRWFPIFNENFTSHEHTNEEERRVSGCGKSHAASTLCTCALSCPF
jgi:hypothetical protein